MGADRPGVVLETLDDGSEIAHVTGKSLRQPAPMHLPAPPPLIVPPVMPPGRARLRVLEAAVVVALALDWIVDAALRAW
jgi:hypothetical protein